MGNIVTIMKMHILMKVETHNHPTAISPFPGAATGSGGEIRDEGATGRGAKPKAGLTGFSVSNLVIPNFEQPWENPLSKPNRIASALDIMIEGPLGGAAFNNEFGRPALLGYFRTYEEKVNSFNGEEVRGYHKPIMLAGVLVIFVVSTFKRRNSSWRKIDRIRWPRHEHRLRRWRSVLDGQREIKRRFRFCLCST